ncbi:MAG: DEAD/DEAH box helicase [Chloroflexi bacterium]|nr:DEAD/DEAH box helicase [Chloroflexota bacterium]
MVNATQSLGPKRATLLDSLLTHIERREAEQIQYGLYDVLLTGDEVLTTFSSVPESDIRAALTQLWQRGLIIRFEDNADHREWLFRSRSSETVRLVSKLRQRKVDYVGEMRTHRNENSPRLVYDLKLEVRQRHVPNRNLPMVDIITPLQSRFTKPAHILESLFPASEFKFSGFQQRAFQAIAKHILLKPRRGNVRGLVVTASTGSGKTYAFFLPVLAYCIQEKGLRGQSGVKAICLYPRVALSENQLEDFVRLLYQANQHLPAERAITVGIDSGASPYTCYDFTQADYFPLKKRGWRWDADASRYICPFARCPICDGELAVQQTQPDVIFCTTCAARHPFILYAKEQFRSTPPDVLVATTESLNARLMDSKYQMLFGNADFPPPAVVMLDEIHLQSSTKGMQIGFLLRRLAARIRQGGKGHTHSPNLMLVGLSATIAQPRAFFSDLTGLSPFAIAQVSPDEESEMVTAGTERYLFVRAGREEDTAVISTLLQTAMVIVHTMPPPSPEEQADGVTKYKTFGFAQSLDIVGRWYYQLSDAEKINWENRERREGSTPEHWPIEHTPLYWYRMPGYNRQLFPDFFGRGLGSTPCPCPQHGYPDPGCVYFQEGECWWTSLGGLEDPMRIKRKTASDRQTRITMDDDLIITTTALEVGYDDASLMGVIQYQAPSNVASFVQRKGRGGRKVGTRPIVTTVLSPYKTSDVFLYQNHHLLVEPRFKKLPLNPSNPFLQRIHGFYTLFDWLAYLAERQGLHLTLGDHMEAQDYATLKRLTGRAEVLDAFREYLTDAFHLSDPARLQELLVDPTAHSWNDNGILTRGLTVLMDKLHEAFQDGRARQVKARSEVLRDYLPQNLFSDINLPELDVWYEQHRQTEDVSLGLSETIPGNVTFRGGRGSCWVAPSLKVDQVFVLENAYTLSDERRHEVLIEARELPMRIAHHIERLPQTQGHLPRAFRMLRPTVVRMQRFGTRDRSLWWMDRSQSPGHLIYKGKGAKPPKGPNIRQVRHASSAYPVGFIKVDAPQPGRSFSFVPRNDVSLFNDLGRALFRRIDFASDADNGRLMKVQRVIIGSQYSLKLVNENDPQEGVVTFARRDAPSEITAIGYEMVTEGITFELSDLPADLGTERLPVSETTAARLRRNFVKHAVITKLSTYPDANYFSAERFSEVMLTAADLLVHQQGWPLDTFTSACCAGDAEVRGAFSGSVNQVHHLSRKNTKVVMQLFNRADVRTLFADRYVEIHTGGTLYRRYLEDTFVHTLKHALKQTAQNLAGVEAMQYVTAYTKLNMDFGELSKRLIWLYELGMGGVGVMRTVQDVLRDAPARFWQILEASLATCETETEDRFLFDVLAQPEVVLDTLHALVNRVHIATLSAERQDALRALRDGLRQQCGMFPARAQTRLLVKLFSDDYAQQSIGLRNWRLYRELNVNWISDLTIRLGRLPTPTEARGLLHYELTHSDGERRVAARQAYPELTRLLDLYQREYHGGNAREVRRIFENAVGRRLLLNCRDACPTCLDEGPACQVDPPGLSSLTLSRALVNEVFHNQRRERTVTCVTGVPPTTLAEYIETLFQQDPASPVFVTVPSDQPDALAALLSHLTDYGIVDHLERRYPRVTQVRSLDSMLVVGLSLEMEKDR